MKVRATPCPHCPFRKDVPIYLRPGRREEIARNLGDGGWFPCHETTELVEDETGEEDMEATAKSLVCAGAVKATVAAGGSVGYVDLLERLGDVDQDKILARGAECWSLVEWTGLEEGSTGDEPIYLEIETCNTCGPNCIAPAGYLGGRGGVTQGTEPADGECKTCGEGLCSECADRDGNCITCTELTDDEYEEDTYG